MAKYYVCYSEREGFDWCIVNEFDRPILHGVGNMSTMRDIVEAANLWRNHLAEQKETNGPKVHVSNVVEVIN